MILFPIYSDVFHLIPIYSMANYFSLPGIKRLSYINAKELASDLQAHALSGAPVWITQQQTEIPFTGESTCACTRNNEHGASNESVELTFESLLPLPEHIPLAFAGVISSGRESNPGPSLNPIRAWVCRMESHPPQSIQSRIKAQEP